MHVDDRLATVLGARVESMGARRNQYRQLLDLVGTSPVAARGERLDAAFVRLAELAQELPAEDRARALGEPGVRLRNPRLVADLAGDAPAVALAAIRAARLDDAQWLDLLPALSPAARGLLRHRRDLGAPVADRLDRLGIHDRGLPPGPVPEEPAVPVAAQPEPAAAPPRPRLAHPGPASPAPVATETDRAAAPPPMPHGDGIGVLVRRIEAFRRSRQNAMPPTAANDAPQLPLGEREADLAPLGVFAFTTDPAGRIAWTDAPVPGMLVGLHLGLVEARGADGRLGRIAEALRRRLPLRSAYLTLTGASAIEGAWLIEAMPDFDEAGHFTGYLGRCRRPVEVDVKTTSAGDRMRQVLHELKTPVNAIQGFAEVIQQQLFGATPHEYRALAAGIAGDAARLLAGFDELDRWARLDSGALAPASGSCDFAMIVAGLAHQLETYTATRSSGFTLTADPGEALVALASEEAERLAWRLLATCAGFASPGEMIDLTLTRSAERVELVAALPKALHGIDLPADAPALPAVQAISAGIFGTAFTFRLLGAEVRGAGGALDFADGEARLALPAPVASGLTSPPGVTSQVVGNTSSASQ